MQRQYTKYKSVPLAHKPAHLGVIAIPLTKGAVALIDAADAPLVLPRTWYCSSKGYAVDNNHQRLHRVILGALPGQFVDHINRNRLDNRRANLRLCTPTQNNANSAKAKLPGLRGITRRKSGRWDSYISIAKKSFFIGTFDTPEEAHAAYREAHIKAHGEFSPYSQPLTTDDDNQ